MKPKECPQCGADISDSFEEDDPDTGIIGGYYCDACELPIDAPEDDEESDFE